MYDTNQPKRNGFRLAALTSGMLISLLFSSSVTAETVKLVAGEAMDSSVLDFYMQSRTQRSAEQVTAEEREILLAELDDIYLLSSEQVGGEVAVRLEIKAQLELQRRGLIAQVVAGEFFSNVQVSEEEILAEYETQAAIAPPLQFKARHILLESQGEANTVIAELDIGGNFEDLAKTRSKGPSGPDGGDLGWFSPSQMVKPFSDAVQALEDGKYTTTPVQTDFGWHVILREGSRAVEAPTLDSVREAIVSNLQQKKFTQYLAELRGTTAE